MKKIILLLTFSLFVFGMFAGGCSCEKEIDPSKAYEYLAKAHNNLNSYYKGDFNLITTYKYDNKPYIALLSNGNSSLSEEYNVVTTGNSNKKLFGVYVFDKEKIISAQYNDDNQVISMNEENFFSKETNEEAYNEFVNSLYVENETIDINGYVLNEAEIVLNDMFDEEEVLFVGEVNDLTISSFLQKKIFTVNYSYVHDLQVGEILTEIIVSGKIQFNENNLLYTYIELNFALSGDNNEVIISKKYSEDFVDPNDSDNVLSGLKSLLDIDMKYYNKLVAYEKSFAIVLYSYTCAHCVDFANSFNYSKNVVYKLELNGLTQEDISIITNMLEYANENKIPTNEDSYTLATPAIIRFENGKPKYISYGNIDSVNEYNYNLLVSIIEGTFVGDVIEYQN